jgi:hypothetical protein
MAQEFSATTTSKKLSEDVKKSLEDLEARLAKLIKGWILGFTTR